jgi:hypothetical protein
MGSRSDLNDLFKTLAPNVYFQPPADAQMQYPCITYERDTADARFAGNSKYLVRKRYTVTVIDENPDSLIPDAVELLPLCSKSTFFVANNLNHDVFNIFF